MPRSVGLGLLFAAADYAGWATHGPDARYLVVVALIAALALDYAHQFHSASPPASLILPVYCFVAWLWVLAVHALAMNSWANSTTVLLLPPLIVLAASILVNSGWPATRRPDPAWIAYVPYAAALVFGGLSLLDALDAPFGRPLHLLNHEKTFIALFILLMPPVKGGRPVKLLTAVAMVVSLYKYPAATTLIAIGLAAGAVVLLRLVPNPRPWVLLAVTVLPVLAFTGLLYKGLETFYHAIGRGDNNETRLSLWGQAWPYLAQNPFAGSAMEERITGVGRIDGVLRMVPFHNSYLTLMVAGGFIAITFFALFILAVLLEALKKPRPFRSGQATQWLPPILAALVSMTVNPIIDELGSATFFYIMLAVAVVSLTRTREA
jgi:O-antigen ligase